MSDFAKNQLLKFGWTEGKGLGKKENGITQAIKPKLKFDTSGIGHKDEDQDNNHWSKMFNSAAKNIVVNTNSDNVSISVKDKNAVNVSHKKFPDKSILYHGNFLKTSTLQDGTLVQDSTCQVLKEKEEENTNTDPFTAMTDEELFKACGGRTAHKGARHGLTLSGKLARVAEQERQLSAGLKSCKKSLQGREKQNKRKGKEREIAEEDDIPPLDIEDDDVVLPVPPTYIDENYRPSKKTVQKNKRKIQDLIHRLSNNCSLQDDNVKDKKDEDEKDEGDISMEPNSKKVKKVKEAVEPLNLSTKPLNLSKSSCDAADCEHICYKCEFYEHHKRSFRRYKKLMAERKKYFQSKESFGEENNRVTKKYKRKGRKKPRSSTEVADKLNARIEKRKFKKLQKIEKKKRKYLSLPTAVKIDDTTVKFTNIKITD